MLNYMVYSYIIIDNIVNTLTNTKWRCSLELIPSFILLLLIYH